MDELFKSKTDLARRWDVANIESIMNEDPIQAEQITLNLLCNPFTKPEVIGHLLATMCKGNLLERYQDNFIKAQFNFLVLEEHQDVVTEASALATARLIKENCKKLDRYDGELRKAICSLVENEPLVNELYEHLFQ